MDTHIGKGFETVTIPGKGLSIQQEIAIRQAVGPDIWLKVAAGEPVTAHQASLAKRAITANCSQERLSRSQRKARDRAAHAEVTRRQS